MFAGDLEPRSLVSNVWMRKVSECKLEFSEKLHFPSSGSGGLGDAWEMPRKIECERSIL